MKKLSNLIFILGVSGAGLEGFRGTLGNRRRVGRVGRRVDIARSERMRATSGKSLYVAPTFVTCWAPRSCQRLRGSPVRVGDSAHWNDLGLATMIVQDYFLWYLWSPIRNLRISVGR